MPQLPAQSPWQVPMQVSLQEPLQLPEHSPVQPPSQLPVQLLEQSVFRVEAKRVLKEVLMSARPPKNGNTDIAVFLKNLRREVKFLSTIIL